MTSSPTVVETRWTRAAMTSTPTTERTIALVMVLTAKRASSTSAIEVVVERPSVSRRLVSKVASLAASAPTASGSAVIHRSSGASPATVHTHSSGIMHGTTASSASPHRGSTSATLSTTTCSSAEVTSWLSSPRPLRAHTWSCRSIWTMLSAMVCHRRRRRRLKSWLRGILLMRVVKALAFRRRRLLRRSMLGRGRALLIIEKWLMRRLSWYVRRCCWSWDAYGLRNIWLRVRRSRLRLIRIILRLRGHRGRHWGLRCWCWRLRIVRLLAPLLLPMHVLLPRPSITIICVKRLLFDTWFNRRGWLRRLHATP